MEKPLFQFGLKAIFAAMTLVAVMTVTGLLRWPPMPPQWAMSSPERLPWWLAAVFIEFWLLAWLFGLVRYRRSTPLRMMLAAAASAVANQVGQRRMATPRRWLQFSLRTAFVVLTIGCVWLGWKVERALRRGRAINALVESGRPVLYLEAPYQELHPEPYVDHFWPDLSHNPIRIFFEVPLNKELCRLASRTLPIGRIDLMGDHNNDELRHLDERFDGCLIVIHNVRRITGDELARLQQRLPHSNIDFGVQIEHELPFSRGTYLGSPRLVQFKDADQPELRNGGVVKESDL